MNDQISLNYAAKLYKERVPPLSIQGGLSRTSDHDLPVAANILDQDFNADAPNQKRGFDRTSLWTGEGWLYLAVALDLFSNRRHSANGHISPMAFESLIVA
jgi:transposase InsO family protein